jgi:SAM-dependent methyltransferase
LEEEVMTEGEQEQATIQTYDKHAAWWAGGHANRSEYKDTIAKLNKFLPEGSILEIGAGGGYDAGLLADAGYEYLGTDASIGMVEAARSVNPDMHFEQLNVYDLGKLKLQFDGFWACAVLLHIPKRRIDEALQSIAGVVKPGGVGFISMKDGDVEEFEEREKQGRKEDRLFAYWHRDEFEEVLNHNGFTVVDYQYVPVNERTNWHRFIVRKEG